WSVKSANIYRTSVLNKTLYSQPVMQSVDKSCQTQINKKLSHHACLLLGEQQHSPCNIFHNKYLLINDYKVQLRS
ncbi:MAG: hypothetical protein ACLQSX_04155, partial [Smithella sp.]